MSERESSVQQLISEIDSHIENFKNVPDFEKGTTVYFNARNQLTRSIRQLEKVDSNLAEEKRQQVEEEFGKDIFKKKEE